MATLRTLYIILITLCVSCQLNAQINRFLEIGYKNFQEANFDSAIINLQNASKILAKTNKHEDYVKSLLYLGKSYRSLAKYSEASKYLNDARDACLEHLGIHPYLAKIYISFNNIHGAKGEYKEASEYCRKALDVNYELFDQKHESLMPIYNSLAFNVRSQGKYDSALIWYNKALDLAKELFDDYLLASSTTRILGGIGWVYAAKGEYTQSLDFLKKSLEVSRNTYGKKHTTTAQRLKMVAWCSMRLADYQNAIKYSNEVIEIRKEKLGEEHPFMATSYHDLGQIYMLTGEYDKAISFQIEGNRIWEKTYGPDDPQMVNFHNNLGQSYFFKKQYEHALDQYKLAEQIGLSVLEKDHLELANTYQLMAELKGELGDHELQYSLLKKALKISESFAGENHVNAANIHKKIGLYYTSISDYKKDISHYQKALDIFDRTYEGKHPIISETLANIGDHYLELSNRNEALNYYQKGLIGLSKSFSDTTIDQNPTLKDIIWKINALNILEKKATAIASDFSNMTQLDMALDTYQNAIQLIEIVKNEYVQESSKQDLYTNARKIYEGALKTNYHAFKISGNEKYVKNAFRISEKAKSVQLLSILNSSKAEQFSKVSTTLIKDEKRLKMELWLYGNNLFKARQAKDSTKIAKWQAALFHTQNSYDELIKKIAITAPDYYKLKYSNVELNIDRIQHEVLNNDAALIEYFITEKDVYIFMLTDDKLILTKNETNIGLGDLIEDYRKSLTDYEFIVSNSEQADRQYVTSASALYDILLKKSLSSLSKPEIYKLIIIPDNELWHLNFSTLLTSSVSSSNIDYEKLPYLLNNYTTSFAYSARVLNALEKSESTSTASFAGFAPSYEVKPEEDSKNHSMFTMLLRSGELPLPDAIDEVRQISESMNGTGFIGEKATETNFKNEAGEYDIIHLAMHSLLNDENPSYSELIFNQPDTVEDGYLSISEIYNMNLKSKLVVLSACNSGYGKIQNGQGSISLSRAFSYAGCPSVVMSLWKIPDSSTKEIMIDFYQYLQSGLSKDEALKKAQLNHLSNTNDPLRKHPFYWASFLAIGDMNPVVNDTNWSLIIVSTVGLVFLTSILLLYRKRSFGK